LSVQSRARLIRTRSFLLSFLAFCIRVREFDALRSRCAHAEKEATSRPKAKPTRILSDRYSISCARVSRDLSHGSRREGNFSDACSGSRMLRVLSPRGTLLPLRPRVAGIDSRSMFRIEWRTSFRIHLGNISGCPEWLSHILLYVVRR